MHKNMVVIGILEESKDRITFQLLKNILNQLSYKSIYENQNGTIIILNNNEKNIIAIDMNSDNMEYIDKIGLDFHILIHTFLKSSDYQTDSLQNIIQRVENIIVNCDEENWTYLVKNNKEPVIITYGFNSKSTINPSSYNIQCSIKANICIQREIVTVYGNVIEPLEIRVKVNSKRKEDLYSSMAVLASSLILGIDHIPIHKVLDFKLEN